MHVSLADGAEDAQILRAQHASWLEQRRAADDVFAAPADMFSRRDSGQRMSARDVGIRLGSASTHSAGSTASAPRGIGAPVMMRTASPADTNRQTGSRASNRR